jgi:hypothetical protein
VFVFGDLKHVNKYDSRGASYWWFHVGSAFRIGQRAVVLDPSIDPRSPIPLDRWIRSFAKKVDATRVSVCDSYAYVPVSTCIGGRTSAEGGSIRHLLDYMSPEWNQLRRMRHDPRKLLGDQPPWKATVAIESRVVSSEEVPRRVNRTPLYER